MKPAGIDEESAIRELLESHDASTSAQHDENVLQAMRAMVQERRSSPRKRVSWAIAASIMVLTCLGGWLSASIEEQQPTLATVVLGPGVVRGNADVVRFTVPAANGTVRLELDLATVTKRAAYHAALKTLAGRPVWNADDLRAQTVPWGRAIAIELPASLLEPSQYEISLQDSASRSPAEEPTYYYFVVVGK